MAEPIEKLAQFAAEIRWEDIPRPVQEHAKLVLLDTLGVIRDTECSSQSATGLAAASLVFVSDAQ